MNCVGFMSCRPKPNFCYVKLIVRSIQMSAPESKGLDFQETALCTPIVEFYQLGCHHEKIQQLTFRMLQVAFCQSVRLGWPV